VTGRAEQDVRYWPTARAAALLHGDVSEVELQATIIEGARRFGWLVYHTHDSRRSAAGFPDLVLARDAEVIFAELKSEKGRISDDQKTWLATLGTAAEVHVWRPSDLDSALARLARRAPLPAPDPGSFSGANGSPAPRDNGINDTPHHHPVEGTLGPALKDSPS
jgi:hypothetical protein